MSSVRSLMTGGSSDDVARANKKRENADSFYVNIDSTITVRAPHTVLPTDTADNTGNGVLARLAGCGPVKGSGYVERVKCYDELSTGFNPKEFQTIKTQNIVRRDGAEDIKSVMYRHLGPEVDGTPDEGDIFHAVTNAAGKAVWDEGYPRLEDDPVGRWRLIRSKHGEVDVPRKRDHFFVELDGELKEVKRGMVHGIKSGEPFVFITDIDPLEMNGSARLPVTVEVERWTEPSQVTEMGGRFFAYKHTVGVLEFTSKRGTWRGTLVNSAPETIEFNRVSYGNIYKTWCALSPAERKSERQSKSALARNINRGVNYESYIVKEENVLNGLNNFMVEVVKRDDGTFTVKK